MKNGPAKNQVTWRTDTVATVEMRRGDEVAVVNTADRAAFEAEGWSAADKSAGKRVKKEAEALDASAFEKYPVETLREMARFAGLKKEEAKTVNTKDEYIAFLIGKAFDPATFEKE